jgi:hypothetical protein
MCSSNPDRLSPDRFPEVPSMRVTHRFLFLALSGFALALPVRAQSPTPKDADNAQPITIQYFRPQDKRGINIFETSKTAGATYEGFTIQ